MNVELDDIEVSDVIYTLKEGVLSKRAVRDGSFLEDIKLANVVKIISLSKKGIIAKGSDNSDKLIEYKTMNEIKDENAECMLKNTRVCVNFKNNILSITNTSKKTIEIDCTDVQDFIHIKDTFYYIKESGRIYSLKENEEEKLVETIEGSGKYVFYQSNDMYGVIDKESHVVHYNKTVKKIDFSDYKVLRNGALLLSSTNASFVGIEGGNSFVLLDNSAKEIVDNQVIERRNFKGENVFTTSKYEEGGNVGKSMMQREIKIPFNMKTLSVVMNGKLLQVIESISGKVYKSIELPQSAGPVECSVFRGVAICFINNKKYTTILSIELSEKTVDWKRDSYDAYDLPDIQVEVKTNNLPYLVDKSAVSVSTLGISPKALILLSQRNIIVLNTRLLSGTKASFEFNNEEKEMGVVPYIALLNVSKNEIVNRYQDIMTSELTTLPAEMESETLVISYGIDFYCAKITPTVSFDQLQDLDKKTLLIITISVVSLALLLRFLTRKH